MRLLATFLPFLLGAATAPAELSPSYEVRLDDRRPTLVEFVLRLPSQELALSVPRKNGLTATAPECGSTSLRQIAGKWLKPLGCTVVRWSASISNLDSEPFDGSRPDSGWSERHRLWLLTSTLPWLRIQGQSTAPVRISERTARGTFEQLSKIPADGSIPIAVVVGTPIRRFSVGGFTLNVLGAAPSGPTFDRLQRLLASTLAQWRRDILPARQRSTDHLNYVWFGASPKAEPGIFASANSDVILIQYIPDTKSPDPDAKLAAGILATGSHEGFHALGAVHRAPTWVNESLASYFAYMAARRHLTGESLQLLSDMINAPSDMPLLTVQHQVDNGNQSEYGTFYSKGARFWAAIDHLLTTEPNGSGRLAALIKQTNGLSDLDWSNADRIAEYLDGYSNGRAGPVVRCFLIENQCQLAKEPVPAARQPG